MRKKRRRSPGNEPRMPLVAALEVLARLRTEDQIVITSMGSAREWPKLSSHPLDFMYVPSTMGGAIPLALGLALAQPDREVVVCSGDGSMLMSLGSLVTVVASGVANLAIVLLDNGVYEVTGGQKTAAACEGANFADVARGVGFANVSHFRNLSDWRRRAPQSLTGAGPRFIWLETAVEREAFRLAPPCPMQEQVDRLRRALGRR